MPPRVVLVGPMGAGKTTVAGLLGDAWDLPVRDTDADIEAATGREISDIFVESGEDHFRDLEAAAVAAALAEHDGRAGARRWCGAARRRRASCWPGCRSCSCGSASPTP